MRLILVLILWLSVVTHALTISGLHWNKSNATDSSDVRLRWTSTALPPRYPITILYKYRPAAQNDYYSVFWYTAATEAFTGASYYQGGTPYPLGGSGSTHRWEIAHDGTDTYSSQDVIKNVWYPQAFTAELDGGLNLDYNYYWAVDSGTTATWLVTASSSVGNLSSCVCTPTTTYGGDYIMELGASPWRQDTPDPTENDETLYGVIRDIQVYDTILSAADIATEMATESNAAVTAVGARHLWYSNVNPIPTDVADKKTGGTAHDPAWANAYRPIQWDSTISSNRWGPFGDNDMFLIKAGF